MEMSAVSASKSPSFIMYPPFSDQSHFQFYGHGRGSFNAPRKLRLNTPRPSLTWVESQPAMVPLRVICGSACETPMELSVEQALMKELGDLKLQMKQKKKQLKAHMKDDKKKLKLQLKEGKKKKQKGAQDAKTKIKCQSESSSSSSESCDEKCSSVSMKILKKSQSMLEDTGVDGGGPVLENCMTSSAVLTSSCVHDSFTSDVMVCDGSCPSLSFSGPDSLEGCREKLSRVFSSGVTASPLSSFNSCTSSSMVISEPENVQKHVTRNGDVLTCKSTVDGGLAAISHVLPSVCALNRIEVCVGGKCKKAGSEELLSSLQGQIQGSLNVEAVPCKCMGKCSMAINVRVLKEDTNPQHYSHVGIEDGSVIFSHHSGMGSPSMRLTTLSPKDSTRVSSSLVIV